MDFRFHNSGRIFSKKSFFKGVTDDYDNVQKNRQTPPKSECILHALKEANALNVFSTSFPFAAMVTKRRWCAYCLVRSFYHFLLVLSSPTWESRNVSSGLKFHSIVGDQKRAEINLSSSLHNAHLGFIRQENEQHLANCSINTFNLSMFALDFIDSIEVDSSCLDNISFMSYLIEKSYDGKWQSIDSSYIFVTDDGERRYREAPIACRGQTISLGLGIPWQVRALFQAKNAFEGLCFLWLCSCYFTRCYLSARTGAALCYLGGAAAAAMCGASFAAERGLCALYGDFLLRCGGLLLTAAYLLRPSATPLVAAPLDAAVQLAVAAAQCTLLDWDPAALLRPGRLLSFPQLCAAAAAGYWWLHRRAAQDASLALVLADKLRYDFWFEVLAVKSAQDLAALDRLVARHRARPRPPGPCIQRTAAGAPVTSLRELYRQAAGADRLLRRKVLAWGAASGALMPRTAGAGAGGEGRALERVEAGAGERYGWAGLKGEGRAIEKLYRRYAGDAGRLLDVCRQSLVFESVTALTAGLEAMLGDGDVAVERVKNRLDPRYDALQSCGYRRATRGAARGHRVRSRGGWEGLCREWRTGHGERGRCCESA